LRAAGRALLTKRRDGWGMSRYIRPKVPGASVFFTVALADRGAQTLVEHVEVLREAVRVTKAERPFRIDAWVVLPDHFHAVWTLPESDADYSTRMAAIKARFTRAMTGADDVTRRVGFHPTIHGGDGAHSGVEPHPTIFGTPRTKSKIAKGDGRVWQRRFYEHHIRDEASLAACVEYCWMNPVKHGLVERMEDWPWSSWWRDGVGS
jgi:putative transposase